jgi:hypothetical protein
VKWSTHQSAPALAINGDGAVPKVRMDLGAGRLLIVQLPVTWSSDYGLAIAWLTPLAKKHRRASYNVVMSENPHVIAAACLQTGVLNLGTLREAGLALPDLLASGEEWVREVAVLALELMMTDPEWQSYAADILMSPDMRIREAGMLAMGTVPDLPEEPVEVVRQRPGGVVR